jgi:hypothetical protein
MWQIRVVIWSDLTRDLRIVKETSENLRIVKKTSEDLWVPDPDLDADLSVNKQKDS